MPVDYVPTLLLLALVATVVATSWSCLGRRRGRAGIAAIGLVIACGIIGYYIKMYWIVELKYRSAAAAGDPAALYTLGGSYYMYGKGSGMNRIKAMDMMRASARSGYLKAQMKLASWLALGSDDQSLKESLYWYQRAAEQRDDDAETILRRIQEGECTLGVLEPSCSRLIVKWAYGD